MTSTMQSAPAGHALPSTLAYNVVHFVRVLRGAGLPMSPAQAVDAITALQWIDLGRRDDVRSALAALLVSAPDEREIFNAAFNLFWRDPDWEGKLRALLLPKARNGLPPPKRNNRLADALAARSLRPDAHTTRDDEPRELHAHVTFSAEERLRHRDFDTLTADEWRTLRHVIRGHRLPLATEPTRRLKAASRGTHADLRASARHAVRSGGDWTRWKYRAVTERKPPLVLLLDISGSMSAYSRAVLYFCHALLQSRERLQVFLFGTRLTNATRALRERDPDVAIAALADQVVDWSGGTRIGATLAEFNRRWARRVLGGRATVLLVTDGLDHEAIPLLGTEMTRLRRFAHRIIWLNPLLRYSEFSPRARGVQAILPHVDAHRPVHNLDSLAAFGRDLAQLTRAPRVGETTRRAEIAGAATIARGATQWN
ncbi:VWA domain-containing protein [Paraburkholderia sp. DHOC27]|uniref:vWA domain-containing protein n=1 Tax=Paraburkholderia sp. DHOC27 TaxID=2303330 RepID=UPI00216B5A38|nr:VWA domain-containing protein [Paraburkholderia sp. DHOC27]